MSLVEFEKQRVVKGFMEGLDVYYTNLGGYHFHKDGSPCYYLNGMLTMFEEQQKKFDDILKTVNWHIEDCTCSHPMSKYQLGWFEAMSLIKEKLNDGL